MADLHISESYSPMQIRTCRECSLMWTFNKPNMDLISLTLDRASCVVQLVGQTPDTSIAPDELCICSRKFCFFCNSGQHGQNRFFFACDSGFKGAPGGNGMAAWPRRTCWNPGTSIIIMTRAELIDLESCHPIFLSIAARTDQLLR